MNLINLHKCRTDAVVGRHEHIQTLNTKRRAAGAGRKRYITVVVKGVFNAAVNTIYYFFRGRFVRLNGNNFDEDA